MELLAAAHASCVCGMIAYTLEKMGHPSDVLEVSAAVQLEPTEGITGIHIHVRGVVPGISAEEFAAVVARAKDGCPISKALVGTKTSLDVEFG